MTFESKSGKFRLLEADPENLDFLEAKLTIEKSFSQNSLFSSKIYFSGPIANRVVESDQPHKQPTV